MKVRPEREFFSKSEFAEAVGISPRTVNNLIATRQIRVVRLGAKRSKNPRVLIPRKELDRLLAKAA